MPYSKKYLQARQSGRMTPREEENATLNRLFNSQWARGVAGRFQGLREGTYNPLKEGLFDMANMLNRGYHGSYEDFQGSMDMFFPSGITKLVKPLNVADDISYRGGHTAPIDPEYHAPLWQMNKIYPDDIYSRNAQRYYGHGDPKLDKPSFDVINRVRGNPNAEVTIYRAVPKSAPDKIQPGDWVTINRRYALEHALGFDDGFKIIRAKVKAKQLRTDGNSPHEFGYTGE